MSRGRAIMRRGAVLVLAWCWASAAGCAEERLAPEQPLAFNHALHMGERMAAELGENKLECTDCHAGATTRAQSGLPAVKYCLRCHMKPQGDQSEGPNPKEQAVRKHAFAKGPFRWIEVNRNPGHVYFSHRAHTVGAGMECQECHGDVRSWTSPPTRRMPELHDMNACMSCHRDKGVSNECGTCHR